MLYFKSCMQKKRAKHCLSVSQFHALEFIVSFALPVLQVLLVGGKDFSLVGRPLLRYDHNKSGSCHTVNGRQWLFHINLIII